MFVRLARLASASMFAVVVVLSVMITGSAETARPPVADDGVVRVKSSYSFDDTVRRLREDIAAKGIVFFNAVEQSKLAAAAGIELRPSTLLIFGNPGLGSHFITARPEAGLDWPVRLLVTQDGSGNVWAVYTDFDWIARRHGITTRTQEFAMATKVIASIASSVATK